MIFTRFLTIAFGMALVLALSGTGHAAISLRLGHQYAASSPMHLGAERFARLVEEKTNGEVKVDIYAEGIISDEQGLASRIRNGNIDMALLTAGNITRFNPDFLIFDLPYLFRDYAHVEKVLSGEVGKALALRLERNGIRVLSYWESGFRHFSNNVHPVLDPEDMQGLKIRTPSWPGVVELVDALGAISRPLPFSDIYGSIERGDVDGQEEPVFYIRTAELYRVQKYLTLDGHTYVPTILGMNPRRFINLPASYQNAITKAAQEAGFYQRRLIRDKFEEDLDFLIKKGNMSVTRITDKTVWRIASKRVYEHLGMRVNHALIKKVQEM